eukprot:gb/GECG01008074.1/.p1 GENE.gb/GECG01008074.1/~~gb/GECG01008074.1/.p1  ORF type:complete len:136 (+),score=21.70 gb/GECG01008074.1/:1-408(+)
MSVAAPNPFMQQQQAVRLPPEVTRILFVRNLPFKISSEEMYEIFGQYGAIRQIRLGDPNNSKTRGTAFVVYEDVFDAKEALEHLNGFNVCGLYLNVLYYRQSSSSSKKNIKKEKQELEELKKQYQAMRERHNATA